MTEITEPTNICSVVGADTVLGTHLVSHLLEQGMAVFGYNQDEPFDLDSAPSLTKGMENALCQAVPFFSEWILICLEPSIAIQDYLKKLWEISRHLQEQEYCGRVAFLSSADICLAGEDPITEESLVAPRTERDLCLATGENVLNVMQNQENGYASIHIIRLPSLYGIETDSIHSFGFVDAEIRSARQNGVVRDSLFRTAKRSLLHVSDACEALIALMKSQNCPTVVNIPGEECTLGEITENIIRACQAKPQQYLPEQNDQFLCPANQHLSDTLFNSSIHFTRTHDFQQWMEKPCAPEETL